MTGGRSDLDVVDRIVAGVLHFRPVGGRDGTAEGDGLKAGNVSGSIVVPLVAGCTENTIDDDCGLTHSGSRGHSIQGPEDGLATMEVDAAELFIENEAVIDCTSLAYLLPKRLFILFFLWFPIRSAYIFTLV